MQLPPELPAEDTGSRRMLFVALFSSAALFFAILFGSMLMAAIK